MGIDELKARLDSLLREYTRSGSARDQASALHGALVDLKVGIQDLERGLGATERELAGERAELATAERRGTLAAGIGDAETAAIAEQFVTRHGERVTLLVRKLGVQREELAIARREYAELAERYRALRLGTAGPARRLPDPDLESDDALLRETTDRRAKDAAVDAQLAMLKKKLGKD